MAPPCQTDIPIQMVGLMINVWGGSPPIKTCYKILPQYYALAQFIGWINLLQLFIYVCISISTTYLLWFFSFYVRLITPILCLLIIATKCSTIQLYISMNVHVHRYSKTLVNKLFLENFDINLWKILKVIQKINFFSLLIKLKFLETFLIPMF